jgi:hypothetical protein
MNQECIFWPMIGMAFLTFVPLLLVAFKRIQSSFQGRTTPDDYKLGESDRVPADISIPNRNYMNMLELPVLFYVLALALYVSRRVDTVFMVLAWTYVALRTVHSVIHLTYNRVQHRVVPFGISNFVLITMWAVFALGLA